MYGAMRVIGVLDLRDGRAVHARAGAREHYEPVRAVVGGSIEAGDAVAIARTYCDTLGLTELYAADLDAIMGRLPQDGVVAALAAIGPLWLDAGVSSLDRARDLLALGVARVIVGLETLESWSALRAISADVGAECVGFSLDLRHGKPLTRMTPPAGDAADVAAKAVEAGVHAIVVIDVARVGTGAGLDLELIVRVREAAPQVILLAGGGVRGLDDVRRLADAGCDGVLVGTALHDGRIGAAEVITARALACAAGLSAPRTRS
jgi:phosphoribosylformimino-5-aminoimidazole carboxamide ribotide isomerase